MILLHSDLPKGRPGSATCWHVGHVEYEQSASVCIVTNQPDCRSSRTASGPFVCCIDTYVRAARIRRDVSIPNGDVLGNVPRRSGIVAKSSTKDYLLHVAVCRIVVLEIRVSMPSSRRVDDCQTYIVVVELAEEGRRLVIVYE